MTGGGARERRRGRRNGRRRDRRRRSRERRNRRRRDGGRRYGRRRDERRRNRRRRRRKRRNEGRCSRRGRGLGRLRPNRRGNELCELVAGEIRVGPGGITGDEIVPGLLRPGLLGGLIVAARLRVRIGRRSRRRGDLRARLSEIELLDQRCRDPRHLIVVRCPRHADARAIEGLLGRPVRDAQLLDQLRGKQTVCARAIGDHLAGRRRIDRDRSFGRIERRESRGARPKPGLERIPARRIENDDLCLGAAAMHLGERRIEVDAVAPDRRLGRDLRIDRNEIGLPADLDADAVEVEQRGGAAADLAEERVDRAPHVLRCRRSPCGRRRNCCGGSRRPSHARR